MKSISDRIASEFNEQVLDEMMAEAEKSEYEQIKQNRAEHKARVARVKAVPVGGTFLSPFEMGDRQGHLIHKGERVEVVIKTRSNVHVKDPRGIVHIRYYYFFDTQL